MGRRRRRRRLPSPAPQPQLSRPHRHRREPPGAGFECFLVLQGEVGLLLLDGAGRVLGRERISAGGPLFGIELAEGVIHTLVALFDDRSAAGGP